MHDVNKIQLHPLILASCRADAPSPPSLSLLITIGLFSSVGARSGKKCPDGDVKLGRYEIVNKIYFNVTCLGYAFLANRSVQYNSSDEYDTLTLRRKEHAIPIAIWNISFCGATSVSAYLGGKVQLQCSSPSRAPVGRQGNAVVDTSVTPPPGVEGSSAAAWTFYKKKLTEWPKL